MKLVVYLPGLGSFSNVSGRLLSFFERDSDTDIYKVTYPQFGLLGFDHTCQQISDHIKIISDKYDYVIFVGHSMGGVIASRLISHYGHTPDKVIAVGTPKKGFRLLAPLSKTLSEFRSDYEFQDDIDVFNISGQFDLLSGDRSADRIPFHTHGTILFSLRAAAEIYSYATYV